MPTYIVFAAGIGGADRYTANEPPPIGRIITLDGGDLDVEVREISRDAWGFVTLVADPVDRDGA